MDQLFKEEFKKAEKKDHVIENQVFTDENISELKIIDSVIQGCKFIDCIFSNVSLEESEFLKCNFESCIFSACVGICNFDASSFSEVKFNRCSLPRSSFINCKFKKTAFNDSDFNNANFSLANYQDIRLDHTSVQGTLFEINRIDHADQPGNLPGDPIHQQIDLFLGIINYLKMLNDIPEEIQNLKKDFIKKCSEYLHEEETAAEKIGYKEIDKILDKHQGQSLSITANKKSKTLDLSKQDLSGYDFNERTLVGIDFSDCCLIGCNFSGCECLNCNFTNADLSKAIMFNTHFYQNDFTNAILSEIIFDKKNKSEFMRAGLIQSEASDTGEYM